MRTAALAIFFALTLPSSATVASYRVDGGSPSGWKHIFESVGLAERVADSSIVVLGAGSKLDANALASDHILVVEGLGSAALSLGIQPTPRKLSVRDIVDTHAPKMQIVWEQSVELDAPNIPSGFQTFATEKWSGAPVIAGKRTPHGAILWVATDPGPSGIERYPYLLQALADLGLEFPARSTTLWAFFDSSYRIRADVDYLAKRWRSSGIGVLHVAAWHNMEPDPARDEYLAKLLAACHRNAILVYAWFELPHVSEAFWDHHPEWREKTAAGQDAQLDWRKLMNLANPDCHRAAATAIAATMNRFDWDGVNLAELYFESLEGISSPARFTPMNADIRSEFQDIAGFDPIQLFDLASPYSAAKNAAAARKFLDFRAVLASRMQSDWLKEVRAIQHAKPYLDIVLTHIDDRFDPAVRDELGADVARTLPLLQKQKSTMLVEDPANLWNLGADRYARMSEKYRALTPDMSHVAVDINVVDRYQDVYPTKKQTGIELFELVHEAARSFAHVAIYFEQSIDKQDLPLVAFAAAAAQVDETAGTLTAKSAEPVRIAWSGPAAIDGRAWPVESNAGLLAPAGSHRISSAHAAPAVTLADFNGGIQSAVTSETSTELAYNSRSRAIAVLTSPVTSIELDGERFAGATSGAVLLPAGQHLVTFTR